MGEDAGLPGTQILQLRVPERTQVFARKKKNEDTSVRMRALQSSAKRRQNALSTVRDSAGPSTTHLLTDLRQQQHPESSATTGLHGPGFPRARRTQLSNLDWVTG